MASPTIEIDLVKVLERIEHNLADFRKETNQQFDKLEERMTNLEIGQARLEERLSGEMKALDEKLSGEMKALDEKLSGEIKTLDEKLSGEIKTLDEKLSGEIKTLDEKLSGEIKTLDEKLTGKIETANAKLDGLDKRLDTQEFISRSVMVGLVLAIAAGVVKLFFPGFPGNP